MANRYWRGNSGNWNDTLHWSTTSGGTGGASVPTSSDDVIFDANSFTTPSSVRLNVSPNFSAVNNLDTSNLTYLLTFTVDAAEAVGILAIYGNVVLGTTTTVPNIYFIIRGTATWAQTSTQSIYGLYVGNQSSTYGALGPGYVTLSTTTRVSNIFLQHGSLSLGGNTTYAGIQISSGNGVVRSLDITNAQITGNVLFAQGSSNSMTATGSNIIVQGGNNFGGGGAFYNVTLPTKNVNGSNSFNNLTIYPNQTVLISSGTTQTINGNFTIGDGASILTASGGSNQHSLVKSSGTVSVTGNGTIRGSKASGGANWIAAATVTDGGYNTGWVFAPPPPVANFTASPTTGVRPLLVNFSDTSTNAPTSWLWNFGDGTTSTSQNPSKTYSSSGTYNVSLTATSGAGSGSVTKTDYITTTVNTFNRSIAGTILFGGGANRRLTSIREAKGTLVFGGGARAVIIRDAETIQDKRYLYKVYDESGNYIETWSDVASELQYTHEINTIGSTTVVELARNSDTLATSTTPLLTEDGQNLLTEDDFQILASTETNNQIGSGSSVDYNNRVDIIVFYGSVEPLLTENDMPIMTEDDEDLLADIGAPNGNRIFTGFISEINSRYGSTETTLVQLTSYGWDLGQYPITNVSNQTTVVFNSQDPSTIAKTAIDRFRVDSAAYGTYTNRDAGSVATTGTVVSYTFKSNTYEDVVNKILELMPSNCYYRIGLGDNLIYYAERSATPKHLFYLGKHISALDLKGSILDVTNRVLFTGGGEPALYVETNEAPAPNTRRSLSVLSDNRVTLQTSAEIISEGKIDEGNKIQYRTTVEILSGQYDIESIQPGDTVGWRNFDSQVISGLVMQVVGVSYQPEKVQLQLETKPPTINKRLSDLQRNLIVNENQDLPVAPV